MTLQQALDETMYGPFSTAYARAEHVSLASGLMEFVYSTGMLEGTAVCRHMFGSDTEYKFCFVGNLHGLNWRPLVDTQLMAKVDAAYAKGPVVTAAAFHERYA